MADRDEWMRRLGPLYPGAVAIRQTTAMRWPVDLRATADDAVRAAPWMVVIGGVLGSVAFAVGWIVGKLGVAPAVSGALAILTLSVLSAAILDVGLARTVERWLRGLPDVDAPAIAADSGLGAPGVSVLLATAMLRVVAIIAIRPSAWFAALVLAPLIGRWAALALQRLGDVLEPPAPERRSLIVGEVGWGQVAVVTALVALLAVLGLGWSSLLILAVVAAVAFGIGLASERKRGGLDSHGLAAVAAVCEVIALIGAAAIAPAVLSPWTL
jgi:adenosylcobinamide-GDP ribazoletransferase